MRVITGTARGRRLQTLEGDDVRPTVDRVKEALFSIIQFDIEGRRILDLFAGSGQLGIEALSRGAKSAVFVDKSKNSVDIVKQNLQTTQLSKVSTVLNTDSMSFLLTTRDKFDIAFLDPPYGTGVLQQALPLAANVMTDGGIIICESPAKEELQETAGNFKIDKSYKYGKTKLTVYRRGEIYVEDGNLSGEF